MDTNFAAYNDRNENASFVTMTSANQVMPPVALFSTEVPFTGQPVAVMTDNYASFQNNHASMFPIDTNFGPYTPHITATPVVKSHNPISVFTPPYPQQQTNFSPAGMPTTTTTTATTTTNIMNNLSSMEIDDYFTTPTSIDMFTGNMHQHVYSPSSTSVTTNNSSIMMIDTNMSPSSPTNAMVSPASHGNMVSPASHGNMVSPSSHGNMMSPEYTTQSMDTFVAPNYHQQLMMTDNNSFPEAPIVPTNIGMHSNYYGACDDIIYHPAIPHQTQQVFPDRKNRRPLPRRHTVSTPYDTKMVNNNQVKGKEPIPTTTTTAATTASDLPVVPQQQKSRKSSLKAKRHRSLGKLDIYATPSSVSPPPIPTYEPLSAKLELWTHEQLLERVMELEKERQVSQNFSNKPSKDETCVTPATAMFRKTSTTTTNKVRSASHTDTELEDEEEDEEETQVCKWDTCTIELNSLDELINHVKTDHIGSGKANYYCCWKDCARKQKPFTKRHKMHNHLRTHTGERPFVCQEPDCGKKFSRPDSLTTHAKIHSNIRPYLCKNADCGKAYYHLRSLRKHERSHSTPKEASPSSSPPPPLPTSNVAHTTLQSDELLVPREQEVFSDWGLSAQAAVFNVMDRDNTFM